MTSRTFALWVEPTTAALADGRAQVIAFARSTPEEVWAQPSEVEGWTNKDILAHIGRGNDQILQKLLRSVVAGDRVDMAMFAVDTDDANARGVEERQERTLDELMVELRESGDEIQELLSRLSDKDEHLRQEDPPFVLKGFLEFVAKEGHDLEHLAQLRAALEVNA
ncbi:MAG: maleylpyruvate isomerase N-terminal domain-containing protein [Dehalococcoidia bacterium]